MVREILGWNFIGVLLVIFICSCTVDDNDINDPLSEETPPCTLMDSDNCELLEDFIVFAIDEKYEKLYTPNLVLFAYDEVTSTGGITPTTDLYHDLNDDDFDTGLNIQMYTPERSQSTEADITYFNYSDSSVVAMCHRTLPKAIFSRYDSLPGGVFEGSFQGEILVYWRLSDSTTISRIEGLFRVPIPE